MPNGTRFVGELPANSDRTGARRPNVRIADYSPAIIASAELASAELNVDRRNQVDILIRISGHGVFYGGENFDKQSAPQKVFAAVWDLESEVNNGGFPQYFLNSSRETAHFVVKALESIGAPKTADICRRAISTAFPDGLPSDAELIRVAASSFDEETEKKLNQLSQEFFEYPHDLTDLLFTYVSRHPESFGTFPTTGS